MSSSSPVESCSLKLEAIIGYSGLSTFRFRSVSLSLSIAEGGVRDALILTTDDGCMIYPLGSTIVIRDLENGQQQFLQEGGHDAPVSCLVLSPTGKFLASGQSTHMGFQVSSFLAKLFQIASLCLSFFLSSSRLWLLCGICEIVERSISFVYTKAKFKILHFPHQKVIWQHSEDKMITNLSFGIWSVFCWIAGFLL